MKTTLRISIFSALLLPFAIVQTAFAGSISSCTNQANYTDPLGDVLVNFTCYLYPAASSYTIDLTPNLTYDGADLDVNAVGAGDTVVINGDPSTLSDDSSGLWNQSLWVAVLDWPGNPNLYAGYGSNALTVYWAGNADFPSAATVEAVDQGLYGGGPTIDPYFFVESNFSNGFFYKPGTYGGAYTTPEQTPLLLLPLLGMGFFGLAGVVRRKQRG
jgi:hypothetical protein